MKKKTTIKLSLLVLLLTLFVSSPVHAISSVVKTVSGTPHPVYSFEDEGNIYSLLTDSLDAFTEAKINTFDTVQEEFLPGNLTQIAPVFLAAAIPPVVKGQKMYVISRGIEDVGIVAILDLTTKTEQFLQIESDPSSMLFVGDMLYVTNSGSDTVSIIDTSTGTAVVSSTVPVGVNPKSLAYIGGTVYVLNGGDYTDPVNHPERVHGSITMISTSNNTVVGTPIITVGIDANFIKAIGTKLYVNNAGGESGYTEAEGGFFDSSDTVGTLDVIDTMNSYSIESFNTIIGSGANVLGKNIVSIGEKFYFNNSENSNIITVIDTADSQHTIDPIENTASTIQTTLVSNGTKLYIINPAFNPVFEAMTTSYSVVDSVTNREVENFDIGGFAVEVNFVGTKMYVSDVLTGTMTIIETAEPVVPEPDPTPEPPRTRVIGGGGSSSYRPVITTPVTPTPSTDTTDCKPGNNFSPTTGAACTSTPSTTPTTPTTTPSNTSFTKSLKQGMTDPEVKLLQQYLNSKGFTIAPTGPGSKGMETSFFGPATKAAVIKFQLANNITPAVGFFGPVTRGSVK